MADMIAMLHGLGSQATYVPATKDAYIKNIDSSKDDPEKIAGILRAAASTLGADSADYKAVAAYADQYIAAWYKKPLFGVTAKVPYLDLYWTSPLYMGSVALVLGAAIYLWRRNR